MALVEFQNNSAPYINADNLNNNFTECNNIVESGSNANGNYIKYSDGTMICYKTHSITTSMATQWGYVYESSTQNLGSFPVNFITTPNIQATVSFGTASIESITDTSTTSWGKTILCRPVSTSSSYTYKVDLLAIGKWK